MTEQELREMYVSTAARYIGAQMGDERHRQIVDAYNRYLPHPRGYTLRYTDKYCMPFCAAVAVMCDMTDIYPMECGCGEAQQLAVSMGIWNEDDAYIPKPGDLIMYDWQDSGKGDNRGWPDHVAVVTGVDEEDELIHTINPNDSNHAVSTRSIPINDKFIRGFVTPYFAALATPDYRIGVAITDLYLRTGPGANYQKCNIELQDGRGIRCALYMGERVTIIGEYEGWYKIRCIGQKYTWEPWVSGRYVEVEI